ncbi:MAG: MotA/TolQ/ExbB proton channel family protein [Phycisphaeraceae bacterium]|nr:MotA/TolQ/ExbB proton channel family protein [Phycisphaeraceae bacterium]
MRRITPVLLLLLLTAAPLPAQEAAPPPAAAPAVEPSGGGVISFFQAFFWPSSDPIGLIIIWGLLILSAMSVGYTIKLVLDFRRDTVLPPQTTEKLRDLIDQKKYRQAIDAAKDDPSFLAVLARSALDESPNGYSAMERAIEEAADVEISRMLRPIEMLNVLGNIAPMIGLFGTVYGMIVAFQQLVATGGKPDPASLAGGISTALVTTFWGLVVAIPALAAYALIRNRVDALTSEGMVIVENLIRVFKPGSRRKDRSSASSRPDAPPTPQPKSTEDEKED